MNWLKKQKNLLFNYSTIQFAENNIIFAIKSTSSNLKKNCFTFKIKMDHLCFGVLGNILIELPDILTNQFFIYRLQNNIKFLAKPWFNYSNKKMQINALVPLLFFKYFLLIRGINRGVTEKMKIIGVGYIILFSECIIAFDVGFANFFFHDISTNIEWSINVPQKKNFFKLKGVFIEYIKKINSFIQQFHFPDIYRGKGICYFHEVLKFKQNKKTK